MATQVSLLNGGSILFGTVENDKTVTEEGTILPNNADTPTMYRFKYTFDNTRVAYSYIYYYFTTNKSPDGRDDIGDDQIYTTSLVAGYVFRTGDETQLTWAFGPTYRNTLKVGFFFSPDKEKTYLGVYARAGTWEIRLSWSTREFLDLSQEPAGSGPPMVYDMNSFLAGLAVGRQLKGWSTRSTPNSAHAPSGPSNPSNPGNPDSPSNPDNPGTDPGGEEVDTYLQSVSIDDASGLLEFMLNSGTALDVSIAQYVASQLQSVKDLVGNLQASITATLFSLNVGSAGAMYNKDETLINEGKFVLNDTWSATGDDASVDSGYLAKCTIPMDKSHGLTEVIVDG